MAEPERRRRRLRRGKPSTGEASPPPSTSAGEASPPPTPSVADGRAAGPHSAETPSPEADAVGADAVGADAVGAQTAPVHDPGATKPAPPRGHTDRETERGLRGLVGSGSSQLSPSAALRARDAARPSDAEVAAAEQDLVIIRRNWVPRDTLPGR